MGPSLSQMLSNCYIINTTLDMQTYFKILNLTLEPKLTINKHIDNKAVKTSKTIPMFKVLSWIKWDKHKETLLSIYKALTKQY